MGIDYTKNQLVKKFIELDKDENETKNLFLYAGGGYGKTTAMLCLFKYLLNKASNGENIVPIYIDVKKLNFKESKPIISYIKLKYSGSDTEEKDIENLFTNQCPAFSKKYTYYILIDGLNETNDSNKGDLKDDIINMIDNSINVRFVISSRISEGFDRADFNTFELQKLNEEQIRVYLDKTFGEKHNKQTKVKEINKSLIEILRIPMFMDVFSKTYSEKSPYPDIYDEKTVRKADILDSFIQKILNDMKIRANSCDNHILKFVISFFIPALAFQMAENNVLDIDSKTADDKLCLNYFLSFFSGKQKEKIKSLINSDKYMPVSICCETFALVSDNDGKYSFVHQVWRDFFAAKHIINCMNAERLDELEISVDENVRQFVGELIREYDRDFKYSKKFLYERIEQDNKIEYIYNSDIDTRRCECDFEGKDNLKTWDESPIEHFMQQHNTDSGNPISPIVIRNLIEIMKVSRNEKITAKYDKLDLKYINFYKCNLQNSTFNNSKVYEYNFISHGNIESVAYVSFSPDCKKVASCGFGGIKIWDVKTKTQIGETLVKDADTVLFSPNGETFLAANSSEIFICYTNSNKKIIKKTMKRKKMAFVFSVCFSPDGKKIVSGSDEKIQIWDAKTGKQIGKSLTGHTGYVKSLAISKDGKKIVSGSDDCTIRIWDAETGKQIGEPLRGHSYVVNTVALSYDGKKIVSGSLDGTIRIWDAETGEQIGEPLTGHTDSVKTLAISQDGKKIVSGSDDCTIRIWDAETGEQIGEPLAGHTDSVKTLAISKDGKKIVSGSADGTIRIWDAEIGEQIIESLTEGNDYEYNSSVSYSSDGKRIIHCSNDDIKIWNSETGCLIGELPVKFLENIKSAYFGPKIVNGCFDDIIRLWDQKLQLLVDVKDEEDISLDKIGLIIRVWNGETGKQIVKPLVGHTDYVKSLAISQDGKKLVSVSDDGTYGTIRIWDAETGKQIGKPFEHTGYVNTVAISQDGKKIVSGGGDCTIRIWDAKTGKQIGKPLTGHTHCVDTVAISQDGKKIVSGSLDEIRIWDAKTGKQIGKTLKGDKICSVSYSPDGKNIVSSSYDGTIQIWNIKDHSYVFMKKARCILKKCDFRNSIFEVDNVKKLCRIFYSNGANVPKKYEPKPIPVKMRRWKI